MKVIAYVTLAALALATATQALAADKKANQHAQPSSYAPRPTGNHVYGTPIEPPIVNPARASRHTHVDQAQSKTPHAGHTPKAASHSHKPVPAPRSAEPQPESR